MDLVISQGEAKQRRPGLFEPKASFQAAAGRALEISQIHAHAGSNAGDVYKRMQRSVRSRKAKILTADVREVFGGLKFEPDTDIDEKTVLVQALNNADGAER